MKNEPLVSIIVPIYNVENYIRCCVNSLLKQTYFNIEIVLVDDGSTDSSGTIIDALQSEDGRIKVIHKTNGGVTAARKVGWQVSNGDYCMFVDGDDFLSADAIEYFISIFQSEKCDFISGWYDVVFDDGKVEFIDQHPFEGIFITVDYIRLLLKHVGDFYSIWIGIYRKDIIKEEAFDIDRSFYRGEDATTLIRILNHSKKVYVSHKVFYHYFQRKDSVTHVRDIDAHYLIRLVEFQYNVLRGDCKPFFIHRLFITQLSCYYDLIGTNGEKAVVFALRLKLLGMLSYNLFSKLRFLDKIKSVGLLATCLSRGLKSCILIYRKIAHVSI